MCSVLEHLMKDKHLQTFVSSGLSKLELFPVGAVGSKLAPHESISLVVFPGVTAKTVDEIIFPHMSPKYIQCMFMYIKITNDEDLFKPY